MLTLILCAVQEASTTKEAMQRVQLVVGSWRCTAVSKESRGEGWVEKQEWGFKIEKDDYALRFAATDSKYWREGILSYDLKKKLYRLEAVRSDGRKATYEGSLKERELSLDEVAGKDAPQDRVAFHLLRENRFLISIERRAEGRETFLPLVNYGCTKEGVPFVTGEQPKCVVTGGGGSLLVSFEGKTYYVCCTGCRTTFQENPKKVLENARKEGWIK